MKNVIYQVLLALGAVAAFFGLANLTGLADYLLANLDTVWAAGVTLVGLVAGLWVLLKKPTNPAAQDVTQDTVKQVLLALAAIAAFAGLTKLSDIVNYLLTNLDTFWSVGLTLIGFVVGLFAYFKTKE